MLKFEVHCKDCVFAKVQEGVQYSCLVKNLDNVEKTYEDNYYVFNRYCNSYRDSEWLNRSEDDPAERVADENKIKIGYCVNFISNYNIEDFKNSLRKIAENKPSYVIALNDRVEHNKELFMAIEDITGLHQSRINVVQIINQVKEYHIDEAFKAARNGYFCYMNSGNLLPNEFYSKIFDKINKEMKTLSVCHNKDFMLFQSMLFKYLDGNKPRMLEDGTIDKRSFLEKIKDFTDISACVYSWEEFFNEK